MYQSQTADAGESPYAEQGKGDEILSSASTLPSNSGFDEKAIENETVTSICHGRVSRLQDKVPESWWKTIFADSMYLKTDGDVVEDPDITKDELKQLVHEIPEMKPIFLKGSDSQSAVPGKVLDLCCGQGRHSLQLVNDYPHLDVYGHDQSAYLISLAKERAAIQNVSARTIFTVGDCRQIPYPDASFDLVLLLGNSFGYFSNEEQDVAVLQEVQRVLLPGGRVVIDLTDGDYMRANFSERSWEWADDSTFVCRERQLSDDKCRLISREIITLTNKGVIRDQFYQERLYSRSEINNLMKTYGFQVFESQDTVLTANSKRKEDLGMMDHRVVVTGLKPAILSKPVLTKDVTVKDSLSLKSKKPKITILLGDTSQDCIGKFNDTWNTEDFETRRKLLAAIEAAGYTSEIVNVVDKHDYLLEELLKNRPEFVFNLCDEGWNNDALKELHVPAFLEMLDIPYSGAGPNCLAFCYDKGLVNRSAEVIGISTPIEITFLGNASYSADDLKQALKNQTQSLCYPAFVKPMKGDNSLGITVRSIVSNFDQLATYVEELRAKQVHDILIQEYLQGAEYGVGMIGNLNDGFRFLPIIEVNYSKILDKNLPPILGFESKWDPKSPYWTDITYEKATCLSLEQEQLLQKQCELLWKRFDCRDYARFDFRSNQKGEIKLLEVNPNPGWCWDGKLAYMAKLDNLEYSELLDLILKASWNRLRLS